MDGIERLLVPASNRAAIFAHEDIQRLLSGRFAEAGGDGWLLVNPVVHKRPKLGLLHQMRLAGLGNDHALLRTGSVGCVLHRLPNHPWMWRTDGRVWSLPKGRMPLDMARALSAYGIAQGPVFPLWALPTSDPGRAKETAESIITNALQGFYALHNLTGLVHVSLPRVARSYTGITWSAVGTKIAAHKHLPAHHLERLGDVLAHLLRQAGWPIEAFASFGCNPGGDRPLFLSAPKAYLNPDKPPTAHVRLSLIQHWTEAEDGFCSAQAVA
jgi:hypothetical protein